MKTSNFDEQLRIEFILDGSGLGAWDWWLETNKVYFDKRWCEILGLDPLNTRQDLSTWDSRVHPDDRALAYEKIKEHLEGRSPIYELVHRLRHQNGQWVWILARARISQRDNTGKPIRLTGTHLEITKLKELEKLNESIQRLAKIGAWEIDLSTMKSNWSAQTLEIFGLPATANADALKLDQFYPKGDFGPLDNLLQSCRTGIGYCTRYPIVDLQGKKKWLQLVAEPVLDAHGNIHKIRGTIQDITEKKATEDSLISDRKNLQNSEALLTKILQTLPIMVFGKDIQNNFRFRIWNNAAERITGIPAKESLGRTDADLFPKAESNKFKNDDQITINSDISQQIAQETISTPNGQRILRTRKSVIKDSDAKPFLLLGVSEDITEETIAREELERTRRHLKKLIEFIPAAIYEKDPSGNCTFVNDTYTRLTGLKPKDALGQGWVNALHPEDRDSVLQAWQEAMQSKKSLNSIYRIRRPDGSTIFVHGRSEALLDANGKVETYICSFQDITEQQETRARLEKTSQELDQFFSVTLELLCIASESGYFTKVNPAFTEVLGYSEAELLEKPFLDFIHPEDLKPTLEVLEQLKSGKSIVCFENRYRARNGTYRLLSWTSRPDPQGKLFYSAARDVTEFRKRELELRQLMNAIERSSILDISDRDGKILEVNDNFCAASGYTRAELVGNDSRIVNFSQHEPEFFRNVWSIISNGNVWRGDMENRKKDGSPYYVQTVISPLLNNQGEVDRFLSIRFDVTPKYQSERLLNEAQKVAKIGSWQFDIATKSITWSQQMFDLFEEDPQCGPPTYEKHYSTIHPEDQALWKKTVEHCIQYGGNYRFRFRSVKADRVVWIEALGEAVSNSAGNIVSLRGTCQDVTALVQAEDVARLERAKSAQSAKLASLGEMSAGIAHEINNPLTVISGIAKLIPRFLDKPTLLEEKLEMIHRASERISKIVNGLRRFSRSSDKREHCYYSLNAIIEESLTLSGGNSRKYSVPISVIADSEFKLLCDDIEIEQVLVNLVNNSIDAVKDLQDKWVRIELKKIDSGIQLAVIDAGPGIPPEIQAKIFEPFFTTKPVGEGTGLGLSISKGILEDMGANLRICLRDGHTCFEITFPTSRCNSQAA